MKTRHLVALFSAAPAILAGCGGTGGPDGRLGGMHLPISVGPDVGAPAPQDSGEAENRLDDLMSRVERLAERIHQLEETIASLLDGAVETAEPNIESDPGASLPAGTARQMPVVDLDTAALVERRVLSGVRHIGSDVAPLPAGTTCDRSLVDHHGRLALVPNARWCENPPPNHTLRAVGRHGDVAVSHGRIKDGVGRQEVIEFLQANAVAAQEWSSGNLRGLPIHSEPLTVRIFEGTNDKQAGYVMEAARIVNAALPQEWKLTLAGGRTPEVEAMDVPPGEVHVGFNLVPDSGRFNANT